MTDHESTDIHMGRPENLSCNKMLYQGIVVLKRLHDFSKLFQARENYVSEDFPLLMDIISDLQSTENLLFPPEGFIMNSAQLNSKSKPGRRDPSSDKAFDMWASDEFGGGCIENQTLHPEIVKLVDSLKRHFWLRLRSEKGQINSDHFLLGVLLNPQWNCCSRNEDEEEDLR